MPLARKAAATMAKELMEAHESGKVRVAVGRASDFFGPRVLASAAGEQVFGRAVTGESETPTWIVREAIGPESATRGRRASRRGAGAHQATVRPRTDWASP